MFPFLERLNEQQLAAATCDDPRLRVLAGAGTGKTTTLTARVARLVAVGAPADRVMLVTFTRRAAREMRSRTDAMLATLQGAPARAGGRVRAGTFHSIAHRTLRRHAGAMGLPEGFSVLDPADAADLLDLVRHDHLEGRSTDRRFPRKALLVDLYSRSVNTQRTLSQVTEELAPWALDTVDQVAVICRSYVERKRALGLLDFDDLLLFWRAAARDDRLGPVLAAELDHVCVDEYQDVNALQVDVLAALCRDGGPTLTVVGDDSQAVYAFRGSSPRHLLDIDAVFPGIRTVLLERNYRSTQQLLDVANAVGVDAPEGFHTRLVSAHGPGEPAELVTCSDTDGEADAVCERILAHREAGIALQQQAVLVRAAHHSALLELELGRRRIPYVKYGGLRFLEAAHVKDLVCAFRLADNPRDQLSWFRLLQLLDGVGPATARKVIAALDPEGAVSPDQVLERWSAAAELLPASARSFANELVVALPRTFGESTGAHAERLAAALAPLVEGAYVDASARLVDLEALVAATGDQARVSDVAADLTLEPPASTGDLAGPPLIDEDWLVISTIHSAKGLEWEVVHLVHASDGNLPSDMALTSREGLEEERRLFYVAVTRAARALHIYHPLRYHHRPRGRDDAHSYGQPSRFLSDRVQQAMVRTRAGAPEPILTAAQPAAATVDVELDALWQ